jgi:hypothetical protein
MVWDKAMALGCDWFQEICFRRVVLSVAGCRPDPSVSDDLGCDGPA